MNKHILIPTDGSGLSEMAVRQGIAFAKSVDAKVTGVTASTPFHVFALDPAMVTDTADQYEKDCAVRAEKSHGVVRDAAKAGRPLRHVARCRLNIPTSRSSTRKIPVVATSG